MALIDLFDSRDKKKRLTHIRNLVVLAASDGELDENEIALISKIGNRVGLTESEMKRIINRPESITYIAPSNFNERIEQLYDMVLIMMIDGEIHTNEIALSKIIAIKLGFKHQIIDKMIDETIEMIKRGIALEILFSNLEKKYA